MRATVSTSRCGSSTPVLELDVAEAVPLAELQRVLGDMAGVAVVALLLEGEVAVEDVGRELDLLALDTAPEVAAPLPELLPARSQQAISIAAPASFSWAARASCSLVIR